MTIGTPNYPASLDTVAELIEVANAASSTIDVGGVTNVATTVPVTSTTNFPASGVAWCESEAISYTGKTGTTLTGCVRGFDGTTAAAHAAGVAIYGDIITSAHHEALRSAIIAIETALGITNGAMAARAITDRGGQQFNVKAYGALGNNSADDTVAIQAAFDAANTAGGGVVFFPIGTYLISAQVNIYGDNIIMLGAGTSSIIKAKSAANIGVMFYVQTGASNFTVEALAVDGNRAGLGTSGTYSAVRGFHCNESDGLLFRDVEVRNVNSVGIAVQAATAYKDVRAVFERCWIHDNGMLTAKEGNDIFIYNVQNCVYTDCQFERGYGTGGGGLYAGGGVVGSGIQQKFVNCVFRDNFNGGGQTGGQGYWLDDDRWVYTNCTFELTIADPHFTCGIEMTGRNLVVDGCEFYNHTTSGTAAIVIHGDTGLGGVDPGQVTVTNCVFVNNYSGVQHSPTGAVDSVIVASNRFRSCTNGVEIQPGGGSYGGNPATNFIVVANDFTKSVTNPVVDGGGTNVVLVGNLPSTIGNVLPGTAKVTGSRVSVGTTPALSGTLALPNGGDIYGRNAANSADVQMLRLHTDNVVHLGLGAAALVPDVGVFAYSGFNAFADTFALQDFTDASKSLKLSAASIAASTTRTLTAPDLNGVIALTSGAQTLSGKTLTAPIWTPGSATAASWPKFSGAGTLLTTPEAGALEYDGASGYFTVDATSGRARMLSPNEFRMAANAGAGIGPAIADFFGATSSLSLAASSIYVLEAICHFTKTTAGTVLWTLLASSAPTAMTLSYDGPGVAATVTNMGATTASTTVATGASASLTTALNFMHMIYGTIETNAACNIRLRVTSSAGTVTPLRNSIYRVRRIGSANAGNFVT